MRWEEWFKQLLHLPIVKTEIVAYSVLMCRIPNCLINLTYWSVSTGNENSFNSQHSLVHLFLFTWSPQTASAMTKTTQNDGFISGNLITNKQYKSRTVYTVWKHIPNEYLCILQICPWQFEEIFLLVLSTCLADDVIGQSHWASANPVG